MADDFVFTFLREPTDRFVSGVNTVLHRLDLAARNRWFSGLDDPDAAIDGAHPTAEGIRQQMEIILDNMIDPKKTLHFLAVNWWFHLISQHAHLRLMGVDVDFIGDVGTFEDSWAELGIAGFLPDKILSEHKNFNINEGNEAKSVKSLEHKVLMEPGSALWKKFNTFYAADCSLYYEGRPAPTAEESACHLGWKHKS
eukprot:INCI12815.4.p1 GENE.INCI12815.4~~INCI12815.4.p1  ORF type:complete len:197 (+),score=24.43 INCI12815.4:572-1162(+)